MNNILPTQKDAASNLGRFTLRRHESVTRTDPPEGMVRLIADLSADHAEVIKHAIQS